VILFLARCKVFFGPKLLKRKRKKENPRGRGFKFTSVLFENQLDFVEINLTASD